MKNKWSLLCLIIAIAVVFVGLYSINAQSGNYEGVRAQLFTFLGYTFTASTAMIFITAAAHFRAVKSKG